MKDQTPSDDSFTRATSALRSFCERVKYSLTYPSFVSFNAPYNPMCLVYERKQLAFNFLYCTLKIWCALSYGPKNSAFVSWSGKWSFALWNLKCNMIYNVLSSNLFLFSSICNYSDYNLFVDQLKFFIILFNLKSGFAWSRDLIWFDTNINLILHAHV